MSNHLLHLLSLIPRHNANIIILGLPMMSVFEKALDDGDLVIVPMRPKTQGKV